MFFCIVSSLIDSLQCILSHSLNFLHLCGFRFSLYFYRFTSCKKYFPSIPIMYLHFLLFSPDFVVSSRMMNCCICDCFCRSLYNFKYNCIVSIPFSVSNVLMLFSSIDCFVFFHYNKYSTNLYSCQHF